METLQQTLDTVRHNPRLQSKHQNGLYDRDLETPQCPSARVLTPQYPIQSRPALPGLPKVERDSLPVVVSLCQEVSQVLKRRHFFQWAVIIPVRYLSSQPSLLICQAPDLPFIPLCTDI